MTGNPNGGSEVKWPVWDPSTRQSLLLQTSVPAVVNTTALCSFWDGIGYNH